ncbi:alpha-hydroxy-acid oxidizing protein [Mesorhizobium sp. BR1-1-3]|uniref:alpha-hydroxy-acid oxidizing protein n=1 Tax=Mesorhizobium sp. BR1-1-3 TaxID=2876651 RepID=UPI0021E277BC|nr:alpha-hydroxy-acid oxidizing protein [Mesorhizobium sp. BR1-1-3]
MPTWADIAWLRSLTTLPLILKSILDPEDAEQAIGTGVDAIAVSNHGAVAGRIPIIHAGSVSRRADVEDACPGATAVMIGRPYVYDLATDGAEGVTHCINLLRRDLEMAMALTGRAASARSTGR